MTDPAPSGQAARVRTASALLSDTTKAASATGRSNGSRSCSLILTSGADMGPV